MTYSRAMDLTQTLIEKQLQNDRNKEISSILLYIDMLQSIEKQLSEEANALEKSLGHFFTHD